jgi:hypothetical protein
MPSSSKLFDNQHLLSKDISWHAGCGSEGRSPPPLLSINSPICLLPVSSRLDCDCFSFPQPPAEASATRPVTPWPEEPSRSSMLRTRRWRACCSRLQAFACSCGGGGEVGRGKPFVPVCRGKWCDFCCARVRPPTRGRDTAERAGPHPKPRIMTFLVGGSYAR